MSPSKPRKSTRKPIQVYLDEADIEALKKAAAKKKVTMSDIVRESVNEYLTEVPVSEDPAMRIVGLGSSGLGDLAKSHDEYMYEILTEKLNRRSLAPSRPHAGGEEVDRS